MDHERIRNEKGQIVKAIYPSIEERFWNNVNKTNTCWLWTAGTNKSGYGKITDKGKNLQAHRLSYLWEHGELPDNLLVRHTCDNPLCVNPDHLVLGTHMDNAQDRERANRNGSPKGSESRLSKVNEKEVLIIRWLKKQGLSLDKIAALYHISKSAVWGITQRRSWKQLPEEGEDPKEHKSGFDLVVQIQETRVRHYKITIQADTENEAVNMVSSMSVTSIRNSGIHALGSDTKETNIRVLNASD